MLQQGGWSGLEPLSSVDWQLPQSLRCLVTPAIHIFHEKRAFGCIIFLGQKSSKNARIWKPWINGLLRRRCDSFLIFKLRGKVWNPLDKVPICPLSCMSLEKEPERKVNVICSLSKMLSAVPALSLQVNTPSNTFVIAQPGGWKCF